MVRDFAYALAYNAVMSFWKRLGLWLAASFFSVFLLAAVWSSVGALTIGNRNTVKHWLRQSDAYGHIVDILLASVKSSATSDQNGAVPVDRPEIQTIAQNAFSPELLQLNAEKFLDGTYDWLGGKTKTPVFKLDFTDAKQQLANGVGNYVRQRLAGLPPCKTLPDPTTFDVFTTACLPKGLDPTKTGQQVAGELAADQSFLANTVITPTSLKVDPNLFGLSSGTAGDKQVDFFEQAQVKRLPAYYEWIHIAPFIFGFIALACAAAIIFTSPERRQGLARIGLSLVWTGGLLVVSVLVFGLVSGRVKGSLGTGQNAAFQQLISGMVDSVFAAINGVLLHFGVAFLVLGGASLSFEYWLHRHHGGRNEAGQRLAPKESPAATRERYKRELAEFIKQQEQEGRELAPKESSADVKARYKRELEEFIKVHNAGQPAVKPPAKTGRAGKAAAKLRPRSKKK